MHHETLVFVADEADVRKRLTGILKLLQIVHYLDVYSGNIRLALEVEIIFIFEDDFQFLGISSLRVDETVTLERVCNLCLEELLQVFVINIVDFSLFSTCLHLFIELVTTSATAGIAHTIRVERRHQLLLAVEKQVVFIQIIVRLRLHVNLIFYKLSSLVDNLFIQFSFFEIVHFIIESGISIIYHFPDNYLKTDY